MQKLSVTKKIVLGVLGTIGIVIIIKFAVEIISDILVDVILMWGEKLGWNMSINTAKVIIIGIFVGFMISIGIGFKKLWKKIKG